MSEYSDQATRDLERAADQHYTEDISGDVDGNEEVEHQYLTWNVEPGGWAVRTVEQIKADFEMAAHTGYGHPDYIALLGDDPNTSPRKVLAQLVSEANTDDHYLYSTYELVDLTGKAWDTFTTRVDGLT